MAQFVLVPCARRDESFRVMLIESLQRLDKKMKNVSI